MPKDSSNITKAKEETLEIESGTHADENTEEGVGQDPVCQLILTLTLTN
jgi:hypothetical protein